MMNLPKTAVTIKEIAESENLHFQYIQRLARERTFPLPITTIGKSKIYDWRQVNKFFRDRERAKKRKAA